MRSAFRKAGSPRTRSSRGRLIQRTPRAFTSKQCVTSFMNYEITETKFTYIFRTIRFEMCDGKPAKYNKAVEAIAGYWNRD